MSCSSSRSLRLVHVSDIHFWQFAFNPLHLLNKQFLGMGSLLVQRARKFRLERIEQVVEPRAYTPAGPHPDHRRPHNHGPPRRVQSRTEGAPPWLTDPEKATVIPGNHDRYTPGSHRARLFENRTASSLRRRPIPGFGFWTARRSFWASTRPGPALPLAEAARASARSGENSSRTWTRNTAGSSWLATTRLTRLRIIAVIWHART